MFFKSLFFGYFSFYILFEYKNYVAKEKLKKIILGYKSYTAKEKLEKKDINAAENIGAFIGTIMGVCFREFLLIYLFLKGGFYGQ